MSAERIVAFLGQVFQGFHRKNQKTLSVLVTALVTVGKVGVASLVSPSFEECNPGRGYTPELIAQGTSTTVS
jgi:hypothetical protein